MKKLFLILFATSIVFAKWCPITVPNYRPTIVLKKANWTYKGWNTKRGKISILFYKNKEYCPKNLNRALKTPIGKFKFIKNKKLLGFHGWKILNFKNYNKSRINGNWGGFAVSGRNPY